MGGRPSSLGRLGGKLIGGYGVGARLLGRVLRGERVLLLLLRLPGAVGGEVGLPPGLGLRGLKLLIILLQPVFKGLGGQPCFLSPVARFQCALAFFVRAPALFSRVRLASPRCPARTASTCRRRLRCRARVRRGRPSRRRPSAGVGPSAPAAPRRRASAPSCGARAQSLPACAARSRRARPPAPRGSRRGRRLPYRTRGDNDG